MPTAAAPAAPASPPAPPTPPQASPDGMKQYYENAPKPPQEPTDPPKPGPGATPEQIAAYNADPAVQAYQQQMAAFEEQKAAYESANGPPPEPAPVSPPSPPGGGAGKPAARIGDLTSHGGAITVGIPNVLIGNKPAAVVTSMHNCPMVTGIVPHVGGPVIPPGSATVKIGNMNAARVGDQCTCTGPPDTIAQGETTTFVG